jgi:diacylglycerol kinase family enzyme
MFANKKGKPIPLGMIPNGSGNDLCNSLGIKTVENALDAICAATSTMIDYGKMLVDIESEEEIPKGADSWNYVRLFNNSVGFSLVPKIAINAKPFKKCCGTGAYKIAAMKVACCGSMTSTFKVFADGKPVRMPNSKSDEVKTMIFAILNSKWYGFMV